jgi:probable F420-dependent oxidoreductase
MTSYGYLLPTFDTPLDPPLLGELGARAEDAGFDAIWVPDSPLIYGLADPLAVLAVLATATARVQLGTGLLLAAMREPVLLAHSLATLDALSGGRVVAGFGAGFPYPATEASFAAVGVPYASRVARLGEMVAALRALWSGAGTPVSFTGRHVRFEDVVLSPPPGRPGGPPIWLAGAGEAAERRAGRIADGWLPYLRTPEMYAEAWARVRGAADDAGRDAPTAALYLTIALDDEPARAQQRLEATVSRWYGRPYAFTSQLQAMHAGTPASLTEYLAPYLELGVEHVVLRVADDDPRRGLETAAAVLPAMVGGR